MHPIKQLQQLLQQRKPSSGTVVRTDDLKVYVATERGLQIVDRMGSDVTVYREGDSVQFANGQVLGKRRPPKNIYVR